MINKYSFQLENRIFRVIPHQNENILFVEALNSYASGIQLFTIHLEEFKLEFLMDYSERQLLDFVAANFLFFKLYPSKILPIVKGMKVFDFTSQKYVHEEPEATKFKYYENFIEYFVLEKKCTFEFPFQIPNIFLFPKIFNNIQIFDYQNYKAIITNEKLEIHHYQKCVYLYPFENSQYKNSFMMNYFLVVQTNEKEISIFVLNE